MNNIECKVVCMVCQVNLYPNYFSNPRSLIMNLTDQKKWLFEAEWNQNAKYHWYLWIKELYRVSSMVWDAFFFLLFRTEKIAANLPNLNFLNYAISRWNNNLYWWTGTKCEYSLKMCTKALLKEEYVIIINYLSTYMNIYFLI